MQIPRQAHYLLHRLEQQGYEAYVVGGCVRDALSGRPPTDWDIATSARPEQVQRCFSDCRVIATGIQHGTVTVVLDGVPYEITTFRADGAYTDNRRPDTVLFVQRLEDDLSRRDFTINAMAYHPQRGLVDLYHGCEHLQQRKIVCVGTPRKRFEEDALRILRALRFASVLQFSIDTAAAEAMYALRSRLQYIAAERVTQELEKTLCGIGIAPVFLAHRAIFLQVLPELHSILFPDTWTLAARALSLLPQEFSLRFAVLLAFAADSIPDAAEPMLIQVFRRLRCTNHVHHTVKTLVLHRNHSIPTEPAAMKRCLHSLGREQTQALLHLQRVLAVVRAEPIASLKQAECVLEQVLRERQCYQLRDLSIRGSDLIALGFSQGSRIGECLQQLLFGVIDGRFPNRRDCLLQEAERIRDNITKKESSS